MIYALLCGIAIGIVASFLLVLMVRWIPNTTHNIITACASGLLLGNLGMYLIRNEMRSDSQVPLMYLVSFTLTAYLVTRTLIKGCRPPS